MIQRLTFNACLALVTIGLAGAAGCGGGSNETEVAQADSGGANAAPPPGASDPPGPSSSGSGGSGSGQGSGQPSGGETYGGGVQNGSSRGSGPQGPGSGSASYGSGSGGYGPGSGSSGSYGSGSSGSYGSGSSGSGAGGYGPGSGSSGSYGGGALGPGSGYSDSVAMPGSSSSYGSGGYGQGAPGGNPYGPGYGQPGAGQPGVGQSGYGQGASGYGGPASMAENQPQDDESKSLLEEAEYLFGIGEEREALRYFYAHVLSAEDEVAEELLQRTRWFAAGTRPAVVLRFAVGVNLDAPSTLTDVKPLGVKQFGGGAGGGGGRGSMASSAPGGYGGPGNANETGQGRDLVSLTGDFGEALVADFQSRWSSGEMGTVFDQVVPLEPRRDARGRGPGNAPGGGFAGSGRGPGGPGGIGLPGGSGAPGAGYGSGSYGGGSYGGGEGVYGVPPGGPGEDEEDDARAAQLAGLRLNAKVGESIAPGLLYVGTGSQDELLEKANEAGVDGLFVFDVEASENRRTQLVNNKTRLRFVLPNGDATSANTRKLENTELERAEMRGIGGDELQKNMERFFARFDEDIALAELPNFKSEHADTRLRQLLSSDPTEPLATMFEARLFNSLGVLDEETMSKVFQIALVGNEGVSLATGSKADRELVIQSVLEEAE
jgi:hypothetical protein